MLYRIRTTSSYRKDVKRLKKSGRYQIETLEQVVRTIARGDQLPAHNRDHALVGDLLGHRECHIQGDWLLIYEIHKDVLVLELTRTGTHAQLFNE